MREFQVPGEKDTKQSFRSLLLNKCQSHFESAKADELDADKARVEMEACTDPVSIFDRPRFYSTSVSG